METIDRGDEPGGPAPDEAAPFEPGASGGRPEDADADMSGAEPEADSAATELETPLEEAQRERDEYLELAQRTRADFDNFRRRSADEAKAAGQRGRAAVAKGLLSSLDNLERALLASGVDPDASEGEQRAGPNEELSAHDALTTGVSLVYRELRAALETAGVESYNPTGEKFDPTLHEAIGTHPGNGTPGVVVETVHKGYRLDGTVLRAAGVLVSA
jgi:molecular chaperone GrpE